MGRKVGELIDSTPLNGARIDIPARIGWLLRASRLAQGQPLRALATGTGMASSPATLSRLETHGARNSRAIAHYETALDLPYGWLRAPIDVLCRTYSYAPAELAAHLPADTLEDFSECCDRVDDAPEGADWLRFAEHHVTGTRGLPLSAITPHLHHLAEELGRAVAVGYTTRYEALAKFRCSEYGAAVADVIREIVLEEGNQVHADLLSAASERPTPELARWCGELLLHDREDLARSAGLAIQNMRSVGGLPRAAWTDLAAVFADACNRTVGDEGRRTALAQTLAACDPGFRETVAGLLTTPLEPPRRPVAWTRDRRNLHYTLATEYAERVAAGRPGEPMLARLIFELLYDFRATHAVTSSFLLNASPFSPDLQPVLFEAALDGPDETTRHGAASAFANLMLPWEATAGTVEPWLASADPVIRSAGLGMAAQSGLRLPAATLADALSEGGAVRRSALFAAGMTAHPLLTTLAEDPAMPGDLRAAARWWLRTGPRLQR
ncbi:hypothetical protein [Nocardioides daejeonensis]|uniref:hypothetical protein n=1 Tax=Nocardioides daejeonensis TaxID=1046556 RepID=UPI000D7457D3|nr:hypothetical protein [Nocardioides daejeonensis]